MAFVDAALLSPFPETVALVLGLATALTPLDAVTGKLLATEAVTVPPVAEEVVDIVLLIVAFVVATAREYDVAVQAEYEVELVQVASVDTDPDGVAVPTVA